MLPICTSPGVDPHMLKFHLNLSCWKFVCLSHFIDIKEMGPYSNLWICIKRDRHKISTWEVPLPYYLSIIGSVIWSALYSLFISGLLILISFLFKVLLRSMGFLWEGWTNHMSLVHPPKWISLVLMWINSMTSTFLRKPRKRKRREKASSLRQRRRLVCQSFFFSFVYVRLVIFSCCCHADLY